MDDAFRIYVDRFPREWKFRVDTIPTARRKKNDKSESAKLMEGEKILAKLGPAEYVVLLDEKGKQLTSIGLSTRLSGWQNQRRDLYFVIGGPDGVSDACRRRADFVWSVSDLTLPHGLVRVLFAEQIYRAWSLQSGHPYHRA